MCAAQVGLSPAAGPQTMAERELRVNTSMSALSLTLALLGTKGDTNYKWPRFRFLGESGSSFR